MHTFVNRHFSFRKMKWQYRGTYGIIRLRIQPPCICRAKRVYTANRMACAEHRKEGNMANPYLPNWEYIPDGEPRVFGSRIYVYGSHDRSGSDKFCDYVLKCWSAPLDDLENWVCHGDIFHTRAHWLSSPVPHASPLPPGSASSARRPVL